MKKQILFGLSILLLITLIVASCSENNATGNVIVAKSQETIKIGLVAPLAGEAASYGQNALAGAQLAVTEINNAGGINGKKIELIAEDDGCSSKGIDAVQKLITVNKVSAIIGPVCSASAGPALPIVEQNKVPIVMIGASAPGLTSLGEYIFRIYPSDAFQGVYAANYIYNTLGKTKVALLYVQNDWGQGLHDVFSKEYQRLGGEIVYVSGGPQDAKDFRTEIAKIKASDAQTVYIPLYPAAATAAVKQIREAGLNIPVFGGDALDTQEFLTTPQAEGVLFSAAKVNNPDDFKAKIKSQPGFENLATNIITPLGYDAIKVVANAIQKAGIESSALKDALYQTNMPALSTANIRFDSNGEILTAQYEVRIARGGESVSYSN